MFEALCSVFFGSPQPRSPLPGPGSEPTEVDLWITRQTYEFVADRSRCDKCGAAFGRRLNLVAFNEFYERSDVAWRIGVGTRCRGWRRHRYSALVTEWRGGLRFGELLPG